MVWTFRIRIVGKRHIPSTGPVILASNHLSFVDHFFLPGLVDRPLTFLAKQEHFDQWYGFAYRWWGQIPIDRTAGGLKALKAALEVLEGGGAMGIYPEGTRSRDGLLARGKTGVARLALATGAPVIPVTMLGTYEILPAGHLWPHLHRCTIVIGKPMQITGDLEDYPSLRRATDAIMREIARPLPKDRIRPNALGDPADEGDGRGTGADPTGSPPEG